MDLLLQIVMFKSFRSIPECKGCKEHYVQVLQQRKLVDFTGLDSLDYKISDEGSRLVDLMKAVTGVR